MRNIYLLLTIISLSFGVWSQSITKSDVGKNKLQTSGLGNSKTKSKPVSYKKEISPLLKISDGIITNKGQKKTRSQNKAILFSEDFNGSLGSMSSNGPDSFWAYDTDGPSGEYATGETPMTSTTAANGFAIFDADLNNIGNSPYLDFEGYLESGVIDLTGKTAVMIGLEYDYRICCNSSFSPKIQVSTDGFTTFATGTFGGADVNTRSGTLYTEFSLTSFLSDPAENPTNFQFRIVWDGVSTGNSSHYYLMIDDISIFDALDNDLNLSSVEIASPGYYDTLFYTQVPNSQRSPITINGRISNFGALSNTATLNASSTGYLGSSSSLLLAAGESGQFSVSPDFTPPAGNAVHTITVEASMTGTDDDLSNNIRTEDIEITTNLYSRDYNSFSNPYFNSGNGYEIGNIFNIHSNTSVKAVQVAIDATTNVGASIFGSLYEATSNTGDFTTDFTFVNSTPNYTVQAGDLGSLIDVNFTTPINLTAGKSYVLMIGSSGDGGATNDLVVATSGSAADNTTCYFDYTDGNWYYTSRIPMVRMVVANVIPVISSNDADNTVCSGQTVTLTSSIASGNVWSNGATTQSITVSASGTYSVTVNGSTSAPVVVTVVNVATPTISAGGATTFCSGGSVDLTSSASSNITWSTGATAQTINVSAAGSYTVTQTISGCSATSAPISVTVNSAPSTPTISASGPTTFCAGGNITLTSSSASGNTWSTGELSQSITVSSSGTYTVMVTANGCSSTSTGSVVTVNANPSTPTITAGGPTTFCSGNSVVLTSSAASGNTWSNGSTSQSITVTSAGNYTVTQTVLGCSATSNPVAVVVNATPSIPTITASGPTTFCSGNSITLTSSSATNNAWNTGATSQSITVSSAGNYAVTVSSNGCSASSSFTAVTVNNSPVITTGTTTNPVACATNTGSIVINGTGTGNVSWTGTASGVAPLVSLPYTITGLGAGSYTINFTNGTGCVSNNLTPSLSDPGAPTAPTISSSGSTSICSGASVTLTSSSNSGNVWSTGATTQSITVNASGSYSVTNTVAGCSSTSTATVVTVNSLPTVDGGTYSDVCESASPITLNAGSPGGGTYSGTGVSSNQFDPSVGTQTLLYTYTDVNGCTNTNSTTVTVLTPAVINAGADKNICMGSSVSLSASGGVTYVWDNGVFDGVSFTPSSTQTYTVSGTDANGCVSTDQVVVTVNNPPNVSAGTDMGVCFGSSVTLTGTGAVTYTWNNGITDAVAFTPVGTATYTVTGIDANGCSASDQIIVSVNSLPVVSAGVDQTSCAGALVTLSGSGASTYVWDNGVTDGSPFSPSATTTYTVTGTDVNGCTGSDQVTVNVTSNPVITQINLNPGTCGASDGSIIVNGIGNGDLSWTGTASGSVNGVNLPFQIPTLTAGSYTIQFVSSDGCISNTLTGTLTDPGAPAAPIVTASGPTTICAGETVTLTSSVTSGITWSNGSTASSITVSNSGTYSVTLTQGSCTSISTPMTVTVNALPVIAVGTVTPPASCGAANGSIQVTGTGTNGTITWTGTASGSQSGVNMPFTISGLAAGNYSVDFDNGCASNTINVSITDPGAPAAPTISASGSTTFCSGGSVTLTSSAATGITWSNGATTASITVTASGNYAVTQSVAGCSSTSAATSVIVNSLPTVTASANSTSICNGENVSLNGGGASTYTWDNGVTDGVAFTPTATTTYTVTGTDANACSATDQITVTVNVLPTVSAGSDASLCEGSDITLSGSGAVSYVWDNGVTDGVAFAPTATTTYTVTGTDANGCSATDQITVNVNALPIVSAGADVAICEGSSVTLNGSGALTYVWDTGVPDGTPFTPGATTTYNVTGTDANGCAASDQVEVVVNAIPQITFDPVGTVCQGASAVTLTATPAGGTFSGDGVSGNTFDPTGLDTGNYVIVYDVTVNGCSNSSSQTVVLDSCLSVNVLDLQALKAYPNPANNQFKLEGAALKTFNVVTLMDYTGRVVYQSVLNEQVSALIDVKSFSNGLYLVRLEGENLIHTINMQILH